MSLSSRLAAAAVAALAFPSLALACPDVSLSGAGLSYSSDEAYTPRGHAVTAGGSANLAGCTVPGIGHVAIAPDFELTFRGNAMGRALEFRVEGQCDTVLLVNDARGDWHFNDDDVSLHPRIRIESAPEGVYDIWVGTFDPAMCGANLIIETF
jgi:hypothetical protein